MSASSGDGINIGSANLSTSPLRYNIRWIEQTFPTRPITESLLAPERESGNLTTNDYNAATDFFPGSHRHYRLIGALAAAPLAYALCRPAWSRLNRYFFVFTGTFAGFGTGQAFALSAHFNFVRSIENPVGFSQAMDNIQKNIGGSMPQGPVIMRQNGKWTVDGETDPSATESQSLPPPATSTSVTTIGQPSPKPASRWEEIRRANSSTGRNSSWDVLRENHEKARMSRRDDNRDREETNFEDRTVEQAEAQFEASLREERTRSRQ